MTASLALIFLAVFLGTFPLAAAWDRYGESKRLGQRLDRLLQKGAEPGSTDSLLLEPTAADMFLSRLPIIRGIKKRVELSGVKVSPLRFLLITAAMAATAFCGVLVWKRSVVAALVAASVSASLPFIHLAQSRKKRDALFAAQLPDALMMMARSLRAGHSLAAAIELIGMELPSPAGQLFKLAYEQQKLGARLADCLVSLRARIQSEDFDFFLTIVRINSESGGNLSEILDKLAETIRSRLQIRRQVEVLTAEGRISGYILVALPAVMFAFFYLLKPGYIDVFFKEPVCQAVLGVAVIAQIVGYLIIRNIVNIRI